MKWAIIIGGSLLLSSCAQSAANPNGYEATNFWIPGLVGVTGENSTGFGPAGYPNVQDDSIDAEPVQQFLASIGLQPTDLKVEEELLLAPKGNLISQPTMQLCAVKFESEFARLVRRKIEVVNQTNDPIGLSTEAVQYESAEAATAALDELFKVANECSATGSYQIDGGEVNFDSFMLSIDGNNDATLSENFLELQWAVDGIATAQIWQQRGNTLVVSQSVGGVAQSRLFELAVKVNARLSAANPLDIGEFD